MSSDIQPGDLVVCVNAAPCPVYGDCGLVEQRVYRVTDFRHGRDRNTGYESDACKVFGQLTHLWHSTRRFRKLNDGEGEPDALERILKCRGPIRERQDA